MNEEYELYPFQPWTPEEKAQALANIKEMSDAVLQDMAESMSEGLEDLPADMQESYRAMRAEQKRRAGPGLPPGS